VKDTTDAYKIVNMFDFVYNPMNLRYGALALYKDSKPLKVSAYYNIFNVSNDVNIDFLYSYLKSERIMNYYNRMATGSLEEKKRVHFKDFLKFKFFIPNLKEQKKIAEILTTWDEAIKKQELLIKEKEILKKGLMQNLLTGKVRFSKFDDEWREFELGKLLKEPKKNKVLNPEDSELLTVRLHCQGVAQSGKYPNVTENGRPYYKVEPGELLIGRQNFHNGGFGIVPDNWENFVTSNAITHLKAQEGVCNLKFIEYYFSQFNFYKRVDYIIGGTGQKEISKKEFNKLKVIIPSIQEQEKIVEILSLTDKEIELLQQELFELEEQRKGLMQKLLTGKVRVKV
jgi:type I restriction enzyme S subunit